MSLLTSHSSPEFPIPNRRRKFSRGSWLSVLIGVSFVAPKPVASAESAWETVVLPILEEKCNKCHNEERTKGRLRMDTYELLMKGGSMGYTVVPGDAEESELHFRIHLPIEDDEHMPPEKEEQLTQAEVDILTWWIAKGAPENASVDEMEPDEAIRAAIAEMQDGAGDLSFKIPSLADLEKETEEFKLPQPDDETKEKIAEASRLLGEVGGSLMPIAQDRGGLQFSALNAIGKLEDAHLDALRPISDQILAADLARTGISDDALKVMAEMENLERLNLENTGITDAALGHLGDLPRLEYLNIYGTNVTDEGLKQLEELERLESIYLWQTKVTEEGAKAFAAEMPGLVAHLGLDEEGNERVIVSTATRVVSVPPEVIEQLRATVALSSEAARVAAQAADAASKAAAEARKAAESAALRLAELEAENP